MKKSSMAVMVASASLATVAHAEPGVRDVAEGLHNAWQGDGTPIEAIAVEQCRENGAGPGYSCSFSINQCAPGDSCDLEPMGFKAIFVGGESGWLAIDVTSAANPRQPRIPLDAQSPWMNEVSEPWLYGSWNPEGNCENDATFFLEDDNSFGAMSEGGSWSLEGNTLVVSLTESADDEGGDLMPLDTPRVTRWEIYWLGQNVGSVTTPDGEIVQLIRCS